MSRPTKDNDPPEIDEDCDPEDDDPYSGACDSEIVEIVGDDTKPETTERKLP